MPFSMTPFINFMTYLLNLALLLTSNILIDCVF